MFGLLGWSGEETNDVESMDNLGYLLSHTATILHRQSDQVLQERLGIGMSQFKILMLLYDQRGVAQRLLADQLGQTEASISRQMKLLVERGLVSVETNPLSKREHLALLTGKGLKVFRAAQDIVAEFSRPAFDTLPTKQQDQLRTMLQSLHAHVCSAGRPHACEFGAGIGGVWHTS